MFYVGLVGPYDAVYYGPYESRESAEVDRLKLCKGFTSFVSTEQEMRDNMTEFGEVPVYGRDMVGAS
jgi:hypothetical protein